MKKLQKFANGTKMPDFPATIGTDISVRVFATDWWFSDRISDYWRFPPLKAFDGSLGSYWHSVYQNQEALKITFDKPQV